MSACVVRRGAGLGWAVALALVPAAAAPAEEAAMADVVVVVDTSVSMREAGMDPERTSLLVTKLFADIVPGDLAVVRLLDLGTDDLPTEATGEYRPCVDDPTQRCESVKAASDWGAEVRENLLGVLRRSTRGDAAFKRALEEHLEQRSNNSMFWLSFRAAQGVFDRTRDDRTAGRPPRVLIWLSDGRAENPENTREILRELVREGVAVEAIVFGRGDTSLATASGLTPRRVSTPGEIMQAFAGAFRRVVQAPYEVDALVSAQPHFEMQPNVDEAWIVVYGDHSLGGAELRGPSGTFAATYAADRWPSAGAYRVAYLQRPQAGHYEVHAEGGGAGVAYAVVQRSALTPALLEPRTALAGTEVPLVGGVQAGIGGDLVSGSELLSGLVFTADFQGRTITLVDDGTGADTTAGDGRFTAPVSFDGSGTVPIELRIRSDVVERTAMAEVEVRGEFRYDGGPVEIDLGASTAGGESCASLTLTAHQVGAVPFVLERRRRPPAGHALSLRLPAGQLVPGGDAVAAPPGSPMQLCLVTSDRAPSSVAEGELWLVLQVAGSARAEHQVPIHVRWQVLGLTFWQRWGWLILTVLGGLALLFVVAGFVLPQRFSGALALVFSPEREALDEVTPQPIKQWRGTGIGFYRNARAYLHADYRLSGNASGALAALHAERAGVRAAPGRGAPLLRETLDGDWEAVPAEGRRARAGDVFRIGDRGPYFRLASNRGR